MKKVIIRVADNMTDTVYEKICRGLQKKLGEASFERVFDNGIIGGFIADADGEIIDMSISSQLERMQREIKG